VRVGKTSGSGSSCVVGLINYSLMLFFRVMEYVENESQENRMMWFYDYTNLLHLVKQVDYVMRVISRNSTWLNQQISKILHERTCIFFCIVIYLEELNKNEEICRERNRYEYENKTAVGES
jgi:hypothetical protein